MIFFFKFHVVGGEGGSGQFNKPNKVLCIVRLEVLTVPDCTACCLQFCNIAALLEVCQNLKKELLFSSSFTPITTGRIETYQIATYSIRTLMKMDY
jgi:hypothetical protein